VATSSKEVLPKSDEKDTTGLYKLAAHQKAPPDRIATHSVEILFVVPF
jgi:hypothetical protein